MAPSRFSKKPKVDAKAKKAAAAEAARLAEEARLQAEREAKLEEERRIAEELERARCEAEKLAALRTGDGMLRDLLQWLATLPLSRKCFKRLDRDFSDGVLIAEIIEHYWPEVCESRLVHPYYSSKNKFSNWTYLNQKTFPLMGFRLRPAMINNLMQPFGRSRFDKTAYNELIIFKLLFKIQDILAARDKTFFNYRNEDYDPSKDPCKQKRPKTAPEPPKFERFEKSILSKIEIEIGQGKFDEEDKKKEMERQQREEYLNLTDNTDDDDWVDVYVQGCEGYSTDSSMMTMNRCWTAPCCSLTQNYWT